jgi:APA family basic amino acid/polyamine antiporter
MALKKELKLIDVFSVATGAMISSGIFILPGLAFSLTGPSVFISYIFAGLLASTGMLSQAELVSAMPKAGGTYFYVARSMGPAVGTVDGLLTWFSLSLKSTLALVGIGAFANLLIGIDIRFIALIFCILFLGINLLGVKEAARIQVAFVAALLTVMLFYIIGGISSIQFMRFEPFTTRGVRGIISTTGFVFISFGGLLKIAALAEEVKKPGRTIPLGMILSLFIVLLLYTLIVFVTTGVLDAPVLRNSLTPLSDAAFLFLGAWGRILLSIAACLAFITTANAGIMSASRYPLALSRDALLPEFINKVNDRFKTPHISIFITGGFMITSLFLKLDILVKAASTVMILTYMFSCLSVIILRESRLQNYQPSFKAPLYPWVQIVGIFGFGALIFGMGKESFIMSSSLVVSGLFVYWFYGRIRTNREFALLYLVRRITAKELVSRTLESELREIIRERDDIIKDRFDSVIEESVIIDIDTPLEVNEFFNIIADSMSDKINVSKEKLYKLLQEREKESSTAITPFLAIPHIIIDGEHVFDICLTRCREGIKFLKDSPAVHAVFLLVGTKDERNFHLRALSAIAQIVQDPNFETRWMRAKGKEDLRDIVLLGKRRRS